MNRRPFSSDPVAATLATSRGIRLVDVDIGCERHLVFKARITMRQRLFPVNFGSTVLFGYFESLIGFSARKTMRQR